MRLEVQVPAEAHGHSDHEEGVKEECECECECEQQRPECEGKDGEGVAQGDCEAARNGKTDSGDGGVGLEVPDGGWGWVVAFGSAVIMILIPVIGPSFGVLFSRYLLHTGTSSTTTSWIFGVQAFLWNLSCLFTRALSEEFGWRMVGVTGALMASLSYALSSFTPAPEFLFFSFSILGGLGGGAVSVLCFIVVPSYFKRRRGAANALMTGGAGVGQITVPPLIILLQEMFSDRGATLVMSALMLHACVAAATFHPVQWHMRPRRGNNDHHENDEATPPTKPQTTTSTRSSKSMLFVRVAKAALSDLGILRSKRACIVCVSGALIICHILNFMMIVPFAMQDAGFSLDIAAWCLSVMALASLSTRLLVSCLSDASCFSVRACYASGSAIMALTFAVFPLLRSAEWVMALMVAYGIGHGANMGLHSLVMIDVMGLHRLAPLLGTSAFFTGITLIVITPLIGMIRDASQSYAISIWVTSGVAACSALLWALMGQATRHDRHRREEGRIDL